MNLLARRRLRPDGRWLLRTLLILTLILVGAVSLSAQTDLTGYWVLSVPTGDGNVLKTYFQFQQSGEQITGSMWHYYRKTAIQEGSFRDGKLHIAASIPPRAPTPQAVYDGTLEGDKLRLTVKWPHHEQTTGTAERTAADAVLPPAPLPLPELHDVPDNGLARTPPMGWNSYYTFGGRIDDVTVRSMADVMVASGMRDAGYTYVNLDVSWQGPRDAQGNITGNLKFPNMKGLADYIHSKGLKIGLYSSPGPIECFGYAGSYGHEEQDAKTYAAWGIDFLKYDWCYTGAIYKESDIRAVYQKMGDALIASGRPIAYSLCQYGLQDVWKWGAKAGGNLWRTTYDMDDHWAKMTEIGFSQFDIAPFAAAGHWNDPDILQVGRGGMSADEYRTQFSLWSLLAAPLLAGNDLRSMDDVTKSILLNKEVIAIDQDPEAKPVKKISEQGSLVIAARPLQNHTWAVGFFNRGDAPAKMAVAWSDLGLRGKLQVRDLWAHKDLGKVADQFSAEVPTHGVVLITVKH
jgi:alpha-galactosidase